MHYPDIDSWSDARLDDVMASVFDDGFATEQEPEDSRSAKTVAYLRTLMEKYDECVRETNRRMRAELRQLRESK